MVDWVRVRYFFIIFRKYPDAIAQRPANSLHLGNDDLLYLKGNNRIDKQTYGLFGFRSIGRGQFFNGISFFLTWLAEKNCR